jgi:hypothetical protein
MPPDWISLATACMKWVSLGPVRDSLFIHFKFSMKLDHPFYTVSVSSAMWVHVSQGCIAVLPATTSACVLLLAVLVVVHTTLEPDLKCWLKKNVWIVFGRVSPWTQKESSCWMLDYPWHTYKMLFQPTQVVARRLRLVWFNFLHIEQNIVGRSGWITLFYSQTYPLSLFDLFNYT